MIDSFSGVGASTFGNVFFNVGVAAFLFRSEVAIGFAFVNQAARGRAMLVRVVGLEDFVFVVIKTKPLKAFDDRARRFIGRALQIGVLDPQQKLAADLTRIEPIEKRGARGANVQIPGWVWSKANSNHKKEDRGQRLEVRRASPRSIVNCVWSSSSSAL